MRITLVLALAIWFALIFFLDPDGLTVFKISVLIALAGIAVVVDWLHLAVRDRVIEKLESLSAATTRIEEKVNSIYVGVEKLEWEAARRMENAEDDDL